MKKIAIVTGASSGMGRDFALHLSDFVNVDEIWLMARREAKLSALAQELKEKNAPHARTFEIDLGGRAGVARFSTVLECERILDESSGGFEIALLVNNAGFGTYGTFLETEIQRELDMIDLNCTTLTGIAGYCLPYMNKGSVLINTASLASFMPLGNFAVYGATKAFVLSFSLALASEVKERGIKVCALCPGPVDTEFANVASNGARKLVWKGRPSDQVVRHCLKKAVRGRHIAIYIFKWRFMAFLSRFVSRYLCAWFTYRYCKRPNGMNGLS